MHRNEPLCETLARGCGFCCAFAYFRSREQWSGERMGEELGISAQAANALRRKWLDGRIYCMLRRRVCELSHQPPGKQIAADE